MGTIKKVFITGANGQLGQALVTELSSDYHVICSDMSRDSTKNQGEDFFELDVTDAKAVDSVITKVNPDVLINNAGISLFSSYLDRTPSELRAVFDVNLAGAINAINSFARVNDVRSSERSILNVGSLYGVVSADPRIYTDCNRNSPEIYAATKAGVIQITKYYCVHLRDKGIRVNAISPGGIFNPESPQGPDFVENYSFRCPTGRMAEASEVASAARFLISQQASYINGHNLIVDGGFSCW